MILQQTKITLIVIDRSDVFSFSLCPFSLLSQCYLLNCRHHHHHPNRLHFIYFFSKQKTNKFQTKTTI